jgi:hypothetical protein
LSGIPVVAPWFRESPTWNADERVRPFPTVEAISEDAEGVVWVLVRDADADWRAPAHANVERPLGSEYDTLYDWILEAIDARTGRVLSSRRLRRAHWASAGTGLLTTQREGTNGEIIWEVWEPVLR